MTGSLRGRGWITGISSISRPTKIVRIFFAKIRALSFYFTTKGGTVYSEMVYPDGAYLVFGKETAGLPEALLPAEPGAVCPSPMLDDEAARSLNLSNTVAVGVYEVLRQWGFPSLRTKGRLI